MEKIPDLLPALSLTSWQRLRQRSAYQVGSGRRAGKTQDSAEVEAGSNICTLRRKYKKIQERNTRTNEMQNRTIQTNSNVGGEQEKL